MTSVDEALTLITTLARPLGVEAVALEEARGRVLSTPVTAGLSAPPSDVSAMDGYALREADLSAPPVRLPVVGASFAGLDTPPALAPGTCMRVFTGAPLPPGADRVVMQEDVRCEGPLAVFEAAPSGRRHVRRAGSDFAAGEVLVEAGVILNAQRLLASAAANLSAVDVYRRPRVAILATGDELVEPGTAPTHAGAIPESVSFAVRALAQDWGAEVVARRRCGDELISLTKAAREATAMVDVVVVTGGASVGEKDFARAMFAPLGLDLVFAKVAMKPGKPVWIGRVGHTFVVGLPGNPTSALVTARLFLAPLLAGLGGRDPMSALRWRRLPLAQTFNACGPRETFHRAQLADGHVIMLDNQDSAAQAALASADLLVRRRPEDGVVEAAESVDCLPL